MSANTLTFSQDTKRAEVDIKLSMQVVLDEYKEFCRRWQIYAQSRETFDLQRKGEWSTAGINDTIAGQDTVIPDVPFYLLTPAGRVLVSSSFLNDSNAILKFMPGALTPVCDGTDFVSILNAEVLRKLRHECKVDVICIVLKNDAAVSAAWAKSKIRAAGLPEDLMPDIEPNNPYAKINLPADMPAIVMISNPGLELGNYLGLTFDEGKALGLTFPRANVFLKPGRKVADVVKAKTTGKDDCNVVLGDQMYLRAKELYAPTAKVECKM